MFPRIPACIFRRLAPLIRSQLTPPSQAAQPHQIGTLSISRRRINHFSLSAHAATFPCRTSRRALLLPNPSPLSLMGREL
jgi:hypothetical protein